MMEIKINGKPEDVIAELKEWLDFYETFYDIQDVDVKIEFDQNIKDIKEKIELLGEI
jgi:hypothetical protein